MENKIIIIAASVFVLLLVVLSAIRIFSPKTPVVVHPAITETTPKTTEAPPVSYGKISGYLSYPGGSIPSDLGVCGQSAENEKKTICTKQIKDSAYQGGVGYELTLPSGNYYIFAFLGNKKAYFTDYVICGQKAECTSHDKIPVVVSINSFQANILPHDWNWEQATP
jgi:hypothetical protein